MKYQKFYFSDTSDELPIIKLISLSYTLTIHLGQGSEWDYVVLFIPDEKANFKFINLNLIYTAITRAKKSLYFIGNIDQLNQLSHKLPEIRYDYLALRLCSLFENV